jgi:hypothetical protein
MHDSSKIMLRAKRLSGELIASRNSRNLRLFGRSYSPLLVGRSYQSLRRDCNSGRRVSHQFTRQSLCTQYYLTYTGTPSRWMDFSPGPPQWAQSFPDGYQINKGPTRPLRGSEPYAIPFSPLSLADTPC